jgi:hypothetical protein
MKKGTSNNRRSKHNGMRAEYNFRGGMRGKHYHSLSAGYTITIRKKDGSTVVKHIRPVKGAVVLEPDVRAYFPDARAVNAALRSLIRIIPSRAKVSPQK